MHIFFNNTHKLSASSSLAFRANTFNIARFYSDDIRYQVNGEPLSLQEIRDTAPESRTNSHWLVLVDWDLQKSKPYVIIDPFDPAGLLYLSHHEYLVQQRTLGSMNAPFTVVCRPGSKRPLPLNSPTQGGRIRRYHDGIYVFDLVPLSPLKGQRPLPGPFSRDIDPVEFSAFKELRSFMARNVVWVGDTVKVNDANIIGLILVWGREILHYLDVKKIGAQQEALMPLAEHLQHLLKHNGPDYIIKRLKILLFCLHAYLGGNPLKDTRPLGQAVRLSNGLPFCFGKSMRQSLRSGSLKRARFLGSVLQMYKYIAGTHGLPDTNSITASPFMGNTFEFNDFCSGLFQKVLRSSIGYKPVFEYKSGKHLMISSAGANTAHAMSSIPLDAVAWAREPENLPLNWFKFHGDHDMVKILQGITQEAVSVEFNSPSWASYDGVAYPKDPLQKDEFRYLLDTLFKSEFDHYIWPCLERSSFDVVYKYLRLQGVATEERTARLRQLLQDTISAKKVNLWTNEELYYNLYMRQKLGEWPARVQTPSPVTGRLHAIQEGAGKVRVVAICDYFTQVALKPVHDFLFSILKRIPTDATFDQEGKLEEFSKRGYMDCFSYDLKSATDLIPNQLYISVLKPMLGEESARLWLQLLSQRDFYVKPDVFGLPDLDGSVPTLRYTRGQPMGALSSWGALALLHHALVQFAYHKIGGTDWFNAYLVLGDDIVIADKSVAESYLKTCETYGITISVAKSHVSNKGLINFAAQVVIGGENISPLSLKEELCSQTMSQRLEFAKRISRRWDGGDDRNVRSLRYILTHPQWQAIQGELKGEKKGKTLDLLKFYLLHPFKEVCNIGKIQDWLGFASKDLSLLPPSKVQELELTLREKLFADLIHRSEKLTNDAIRLQTLALEVATHKYKNTLRAKAWTYVSESVAKSVTDNQLRPLAHVYDYLKQAMVAPFANAMDPSGLRHFQPGGVAAAYMEIPLKVIPPLQDLLAIWIDLAKTPSLSSNLSMLDDFPSHVFDIIKNIDPSKKVETTVKKSWFRKKIKYLPSWTKIKEAFRIPKLPLASAVRKVLGAPLPIFTVIDGTPPPYITQQLSIQREKYLADRIKDAASPCQMGKTQLLGAMVGLCLVNPTPKSQFDIEREKFKFPFTFPD